MNWREEYDQIIAERQAEQERLQKGNEELQRQLDSVLGTWGALDSIGKLQWKLPHSEVAA